MKKKLKLSIIVIILVFLIVELFMWIMAPRNYSKTYTVDGVEVTEKYNKFMNYYTFKYVYKDYVFHNVYSGEFTKKKKLIEKVSIFQEEDEVCILPHGEREFMPLCMKDKEYVDIAFLESDTSDFYKREEIKDESETYKKLKVYTTKLGNVLVWAHKGYYFISGSEKGEIKFLDKEEYYNKLSYQVDEYVITPNYDQNHTFNAFYIINMKNGKLTKWDIEFDINYNSYYLGSLNGKIYLFDKKEKIEYEINPKKKKIEIVSDGKVGKVYLKEWEEVSTTKLANNEYKFEFDKVYNYTTGEKKLTLDYIGLKDRILISNKDNSKIVKDDGDKVYYLVKNSLYHYSPKYGEVEMIKYSEWEFNDLNAIYIY